MSELIVAQDAERERRVETLRHVIEHLHRGGSPAEVRARLTAVVRETDASEIADMEQRLIASGVSVDQVRSMCDLHADVLRDVMTRQRPQPLLLPGHPVDQFRRENRALAATLAEARELLGRIEALPDDADAGELLAALRERVTRLSTVDAHYARKEYLVFSCLERHGITGPSQVMWAKDDEVRAALRTLVAALAEPDTDAAAWKLVAEALARPAFGALEGMIDKEERILLPMALETLTPAEWGEVWRETPRYGVTLVEPRAGYAPPRSAEPRSATDPAEAPAAEPPARGEIVLPTGRVALDTLTAIFAALPVDITFVDADDRVAFFTEGPDRIFPRSRAILGRAVQNCHPPKSLHVVERILSDFRAGRQGVAEFWIELKGRMVHIRYFAVRDAAGTYLGTLEVTQDVTRIRALSGERRLLSYEAG